MTEGKKHRKTRHQETEQNTRASEPGLSCLLDAIPKAVCPVHQANTQRIFSQAQEVKGLATGYAWRLPHEADHLQTIVDFVRYEHLCCPFFHFTLEIEPEQGPIWLQMTGKSDVKEFIQSEGWIAPMNSPVCTSDHALPSHTETGDTF